jgi:hypothetical protein
VDLGVSVCFILENNSKSETNVTPFLLYVMLRRQNFNRAEKIKKYL